MAAEEARVRTDPRFRRRRQAVRRSRRKRLFVGLAATFTLATLVWAMFWSPLLVVRAVKVQGARNVAAGDVVNATALVGADENLLLLSTEEVATRVEELPWVKDADVDRMLPNTVRVRVAERKPALLLSIGAAHWTLDRRGHVLAAGESRSGLPVLAGVEVAEVEPGVRLMTPESIDALKVFRSLPRGLRKQLAGIFAPTRERITLSLASGTVIRIGAAEKLTPKIKVLRALLARLRQRQIATAYVDVRVPTNPAISEAPPSASETEAVLERPDPGASPSP